MNESRNYDSLLFIVRSVRKMAIGFLGGFILMLGASNQAISLTTLETGALGLLIILFALLVLK